MKKGFFLLYMALLTFPLGFLFGQPVGGFYYQASLRDAAGKLMNEQDVELQINLLADELDGELIYSENQTMVTSQYGIVNMIIGGGSAISGDFNSLNWGARKYFIELLIYDAVDEEFKSIGASQILFVPLANYALRAGNVKDTSITNEIQTLSYENDSLRISQGNSIPFIPGLWNKNEEVTYIAEGSVTIGSDSVSFSGINQETKFQIDMRGDIHGLSLGEKRGMLTFIDFKGESLKGGAYSTLGLGKDWIVNSVGAAVHGSINSLKYINSSPGYASGAGSGLFDTKLDNLEFGNIAGQYLIAGVETKIQGSLASHPSSALISALFATDNINSGQTYGAYITGRTYISGNTGLGVSNPERKLHISDAMRLEPRGSEPADPQKGDIYMDNTSNKLRVFDGTQWQDCW